MTKAVLRIRRDVKRVHKDVAVLIEAGLIEKTDSGKIHVPYAVIEADFALKAAWPPAESDAAPVQSSPPGYGSEHEQTIDAG